MRALITRPREDAEPLAGALEARGIQPMIEPLFTIVPKPDAGVALDGVQAMLLTSANGARALAAATGRRDLQVLAVGDATAETARGLGFTRVESAGGDVDDLARLARERLDPARGALLHAAGSVVAGDLSGVLAAAGFRLRRVVLYETRKVARLSAGAVEALEAGALDAILFFSPRTASAFVSLADEAGVTAACQRVTAFCLSPAVAEAAEAIGWRQVRVAPRPDSAALLELIDATLGEGGGRGEE